MECGGVWGWGKKEREEEVRDYGGDGRDGRDGVGLERGMERREGIQGLSEEWIDTYLTP